MGGLACEACADSEPSPSYLPPQNLYKMQIMDHILAAVLCKVAGIQNPLTPTTCLSERANHNAPTMHALIKRSPCCVSHPAHLLISPGSSIIIHPQTLSHDAWLMFAATEINHSSSFVLQWQYIPDWLPWRASLTSLSCVRQMSASVHT